MTSETFKAELEAVMAEVNKAKLYYEADAYGKGAEHAKNANTILERMIKRYEGKNTNENRIG